MARVPPPKKYQTFLSEAKKSKLDFTKGQIKDYEKWHEKLGKKSNRLDGIDKKFRDFLKELLKSKKGKDDEEGVKAAVKAMKLAHEVETFEQVPVHPKKPPPLKKAVGVNSVEIYVVLILWWILAVKREMAKAEAVSKKKDKKNA